MELGYWPRHSLRAQSRNAALSAFTPQDFRPPEGSKIKLEQPSTEKPAPVKQPSKDLVSQLDAWLGTVANLSEESVFDWQEAYLAGPLEPIVETPLLDFSPSNEEEQRDQAEQKQQTPIFDPLEPIRHHQKAIVQALPNGERREIFDCGSEIVKDAIGRVVHVSSENEGNLYFTYGRDGKLISFIRTNGDGKAMCSGTRDMKSVTVRDHAGRVKVVGETMDVDPMGCLSIRNRDGQYWTIDPLRAMYVERRLLSDEKGLWTMLTGFFTSDGFRMITRFRPIDRKVENKAERLQKNSTYRFYGRDGSLITFTSEESLRAMNPTEALPPGSRSVEVGGRFDLQNCREPVKGGRRHAHTAWQSVTLYLDEFLPAFAEEI